MAEVNDTASAPPSAGGTRSGTGFELRLERGGASVRLADKELVPGLALESLAIQIPDVRFPFDVGQGAAQFRHRLADLAELFVSVSSTFLDEALRKAPLAEAGLLDVRTELRGGFAELSGRLAGGPAFTLKAGLLPHGEHGLRALFHSPRVFGLSPLPSSALPHVLSRALSGVLEGGALDPVARLLRHILAPRSWKIPRTAGIRLARAEIADGALRLGWAPATGAPALRTDPDLLAAEEGAGSFARAEAAIAAGDWARARDLLLGAGHSASVHPFAAERLLSLFVLEERFHEEVLDLSADWLGRRPGFAPALAAEALVRLARGERQRAARAWGELARTAAERGEVFTALSAAQMAFETPGAAREDAARAVDVALGLRRDHVPALRALRTLSAEAGDREALLRADRRIVAYDPDDAQKARAHAELGELLREADPAAARLHLDQALRLAPDDPATLAALGHACAAAGEPLRAVRAVDRLRELHLARGDQAAAAAAALEAGALWEGPLDQPENAALRYRAAVELAPTPDAHARLARVAERLGQWVEAADHHAAVIASLDPAAPGAAQTLARTRLALADVAEKRLGDPAGAAAHLEAAAALQPDEAVLRRLADLHRALHRPDGLAAALDRLAPLAPPPERAALLAEAGEALLSIGQAEAARVRFAAALAHDGVCRPALLGLSRLAATRGDVLAERDALARLVPLAASAAEVADLQDRLAAACEAAGDLTGAARAARAARNAVPSGARLATELRLLRRAGDTAALTALLPEAAQAAAAAGEPGEAAALRLEQARLLAPDAPAAALAALSEAHAAAPGDPAVLRAQAELAERTGDLRLALAALRALLAGSPPDAPSLEVRAGRAALSAGEITAAREHATRAEASGAAGGADLLGEVLARTGDGAARAELLVRVGRLDEAAELFVRTGRPGEAAPLLDRLGRHQDAARAWQAAGDLSRAAAALARAAEDPAQAAEVLPRLVEARLALQDAPGAAVALLRLARLRTGAEAAQLAWRSHELRPDAEAVELAVTADPAFAPARARRAELRAGHDPRGALADAEAALAAADLPDAARPGLRILAWRAAAALGDAGALARHLQGYLALYPGDPEALARLAGGDLAATAAALARAAEDPAAAPALLPRLVEARLALEDDAGAAEALLALARLRTGPEAARLAWRSHELRPDPEALELALAADPAFVPARLRRAELRAPHDPRGALADAEAALASPDLPEAAAPGLRSLAWRSAAALGDAGALVRHLQDHLSLHPDDPDALARLAGGDLAAAADALARAAQDPAAAPEVLPRLAEARLALQDFPGAAAALLELARLRTGSEAARLAWQSHELRPDPAALDLTIAADPGFVPARARRATLRAASDPAGALTDAEAALAAPELPAEARPGLLDLAWHAAEALGDAGATLRHLEAYCALIPGDDAALARLAALHKRAGDAAALAAILDRRIAPASGPEAVALRLERAELFAHDGDAPAAARLLEQALELDPSSLAALRALTDAPVREAVPPLRRAELLAQRAEHPGAAPDEIPAALAERARLLAEAGEGAAALASLRTAAERAPLDDAGLELRAALAGAAGAQAEAAVALLERARRARAAGEAGAADRLAEAGLAADAAGVPGADEALEAALQLGPGRENARAVRLLLVQHARDDGDEDGERALLAELVPLLRTGERPAALLRLAALTRAAGDLGAARAAADEARALSPRSAEAIEASRAIAEQQGDLAAAAERLGELAELVPAERGPRLLARARLLAFLGRHEEADRDFTAALALLPPDRALAEEHLRFRRENRPTASAAEPLERFAGRAADKKEQARAYRTAAALALTTGDRAAALRCARRAVARSRDDLAFAGPLLARLLYEGGSSAEALVLHRRLFEAGLDRLPPEEALVLARQLAELAEEAQETELARAALDQVLALRPSDLDAAIRRFRLDADRARAARDLAAQADFCRSAARRAEALAAAAEASLGEIGDAPLADLLFRRARDAALRLPARAAAMARRRVEAFRAAEGTKSPMVVEALGEAAEQALRSGNRAEARELLGEAAARARDRGQLANAAHYVRRLFDLAAEEGDKATAIAHAREAGDLYAWAGMLPDAAAALKGAVELDPEDVEALALLEAVARAQGPEGAPLLTEVLGKRIARTEPGPMRAELRVALADAMLEAGGPGSTDRAEAELRAALEEDPGCTAASERLSERLSGAGRDAERARFLLERAAYETDRAAAAKIRREAATLLAAVPGAADRAIAASTFAELAAEDPRDLDAHRAAARLYRDLNQREKAISHLAALVRAAPDDEVASRELAEAYSDRHRERADLFLQRAESAQGETRAVRLREAAKALFAAGEDLRARAVLVDAFEAWPADDTAFVAALREAATDVERIDAVLSARAGAVPKEAAACHRARADALLAFGESERAVTAYQAALAVAPDDVAALAALAACLASAGRDAEARAVDARLVVRADADPKAVAPSAEASARYRLGLAAWAEGRPADGIAHLERALSLAPGDDRAGIAWAALAHGHAARSDGPMALAAARSRAERAQALGLAEERRQALEAGAELASQLAEDGRDAAEILVALLRLRHEDGEPGEALEPLARRTATVLEALGEPGRAIEALALAGVAPVVVPPEPPAAPEPAEPPAAGAARPELLEIPEADVADVIDLWSSAAAAATAAAGAPEAPEGIDALGVAAPPPAEPPALAAAPDAGAADLADDGAGAPADVDAAAPRPEELAGAAAQPEPPASAESAESADSFDISDAFDAEPSPGEASASEPPAGDGFVEGQGFDAARSDPFADAFEAAAPHDALEPAADPAAAAALGDAGAPKAAVPDAFPGAVEAAEPQHAAEPAADATTPPSAGAPDAATAAAFACDLDANLPHGLAEPAADAGEAAAVPDAGGPDAALPGFDAAEPHVPAAAAELPPDVAVPDAGASDAGEPRVAAAPAESLPDAADFDIPVADAGAFAAPEPRVAGAPADAAKRPPEAADLDIPVADAGSFGAAEPHVPEAPAVAAEPAPAAADLDIAVPEAGSLDAALPEPRPADERGAISAAADGGAGALHERPVEDAAEPGPADPLEAARQAAELALSIEEPAERSAAFLAYAEALGAAGAPVDDVRTALDLATEADPDSAAPWRARARIETDAGQPTAAARAHLAVSIRTEGAEAARSALEAAHLFQRAGQRADAARAFRVAIHADPGSATARQALAEEALDAGDAEAAAVHLSAIDPDQLPPEERPDFARKLARALAAAGRSADAEAVWSVLFHADPADAEAFDEAAARALERGAVDAWIELAQVREQALAQRGDAGAQAELRRREGELLAGAGRLEAARGALLSALELRPDDAATTTALSALDARTDAWRGVAAGLAAEAARSGDPAARAALHLRRARIVAERLRDGTAAVAAAEAAASEARRSAAGAAQRTAADAEALLAELRRATAVEVPAPERPDPVSAVLRGQAEAAHGSERADLFERLAGHLERTGDRDGAADALLQALEAEPDREATHVWLATLVPGDVARLARAAALRVPAAPPSSPELDALAASEPDATAAPDPEAPVVPVDRGEPNDADMAPVRTPLPAPPPDAEFTPPELLDLPPSETLEVPPFAVADLPPLDLGATDLGLGLSPDPVSGPASEPAWEPPPPSEAAPPPPAHFELDLEDGDGAAPPPAVDPATPPPGDAPAPDAAALGRQHLAGGEHELAYAELSRALEAAPGDLDLVRDLMQAAEKIGEADRYAELGERLADAVAATDRIGAAVRLRQLAGAMRGRFGRPERAAPLLEKALALVPGDPDTQRELAATLAERPRNAPRALESWLGIVRQDPSDAGALSALAALCVRSPQGADAATLARLAELGRIAASLAAFDMPGSPRPPPHRIPARVPPDLRAQLAVPVAVGPSARLLSLLAPWLEPLFPADLGRRGASPADWLAPPRAPALRSALEAAARALGTRPHAAFLTRRPGVDAAIENTQPPAMVFTAGIADLPAPMLAFLSARSLDLVHHGWALAGKFAPRDVGILLELACRYAGGQAPSLGLPAERAGSYLAALSRTVPAGILERARILASESARELTRFEPSAFAEALRRTANRMALLYAGDPGEALRMLAALEPGSPTDPGQALSRPDLADLARFALSDRFLELRLAVLA